MSTSCNKKILEIQTQINLIKKDLEKEKKKKKPSSNEINQLKGWLDALNWVQEFILK